MQQKKQAVMLILIGSELNIKINKLPMLGGQSVVIYNYKTNKETSTTTSMKVCEKGRTINIYSTNGRFVLTK